MGVCSKEQWKSIAGSYESPTCKVWLPNVTSVGIPIDQFRFAKLVSIPVCEGRFYSTNTLLWPVGPEPGLRDGGPERPTGPRWHASPVSLPTFSTGPNQLLASHFFGTVGFSNCWGNAEWCRRRPRRGVQSKQGEAGRERGRMVLGPA